MDISNLSLPNEIHSTGFGMLRGNDDLLIVKFYKNSVYNPRKSKEAGHIIHDAVDYVLIQHPGERDNTNRPVKVGEDDLRFPRQWMQFQKSLEQVPEGTPLSALFVDPNLVNVPPYLNGIGIYTVEQLADLSATAIQNIGLGGQEWNNLARKYLDVSNKGREFHRLDRENKDLKNSQQVQQQQIEALKAQVNQLISERYGQTGMPNHRPQSHQSISNQMHQVRQAPPLVPSDDPDTIVEEFSGLNAGESIPVFTDPEPRRRGRPPGSKNNPAASD